jgi:hypothetical protein
MGNLRKVEVVREVALKDQRGLLVVHGGEAVVVEVYLSGLEFHINKVRNTAFGGMEEEEVKKRNQKFGPLIFYRSFPFLLHNYTRESWIGPTNEQVSHREARFCQS